MTAPTQERRHRGRHPADDKLFAAPQWPTLQQAVADLSWLLGRGYSETSALKLVGDRHQLRLRQRQAVLRSACTDDARRERQQRHLATESLAGRDVWLDGFNCIITIEAGLSGGVILRGRDGAHRDMSSVHGSYRRVVETERAVQCIADLLRASRAASVHWLLDRPVSNSGRLATVLRAAAPPGMSWTVDLVFNPDRDLCQPDPGHPRVVASSDAWVLDHCNAWCDLPAAVIARDMTSPWVVDMGQGPQAP